MPFTSRLSIGLCYSYTPAFRYSRDGIPIQPHPFLYVLFQSSCLLPVGQHCRKKHAGTTCRNSAAPTFPAATEHEQSAPHTPHIATRRRPASITSQGSFEVQMPKEVKLTGK